MDRAGTPTPDRAEAVKLKFVSAQRAGCTQSRLEVAHAVLSVEWPWLLNYTQPCNTYTQRGAQSIRVTPLGGPVVAALLVVAAGAPSAPIMLPGEENPYCAECDMRTRYGPTRIHQAATGRAIGGTAQLAYIIPASTTGPYHYQ